MRGIPARDRLGRMVHVGVFGAGGRMGREVCRAVQADPELVLAAAVLVSAICSAWCDSQRYFRT